MFQTLVTVRAFGFYITYDLPQLCADTSSTRVTLFLCSKLDERALMPHLVARAEAHCSLGAPVHTVKATVITTHVVVLFVSA